MKFLWVCVLTDRLIRTVSVSYANPVESDNDVLTFSLESKTAAQMVRDLLIMQGVALEAASGAGSPVQFTYDCAAFTLVLDEKEKRITITRKWAAGTGTSHGGRERAYSGGS